ncbi:hypothetical protein E2C01_078508 [Portunus trituberculatus]|uniref:Uncharacterized protein n=1 Tax=Portunus trituberculatus TaxID=210409 RepID=A0A5B7IIZ4_PORTR|nr:hypothetical protein [Portunus trituberculatus]
MRQRGRQVIRPPPRSPFAGTIPTSPPFPRPAITYVSSSSSSTHRSPPPPSPLAVQGHLHQDSFAFVILVSLVMSDAYDFPAGSSACITTTTTTTTIINTTCMSRIIPTITTTTTTTTIIIINTTCMSRIIPTTTTTTTTTTCMSRIIPTITTTTTTCTSRIISTITATFTCIINTCVPNTTTTIATNMSVNQRPCSLAISTTDVRRCQRCAWCCLP